MRATPAGQAVSCWAAIGASAVRWAMARRLKFDKGTSSTKSVGFHQRVS
jgi:hypothetical protein